MLTLTKNQYQDYLKILANRYYSDKDFSIEDYRQKADNVKILDFDLSAFPDISPKTQKYINKFFEYEDKDRNGNYMLRGTDCHSDHLRALIFSTLNLTGNIYGLSSYAYNDNELMIFTYCEGDITLTLFNNRAAYEADKKATIDWYKNN